jgi:hypothetical protein
MERVSTGANLAGTAEVAGAPRARAVPFDKSYIVSPVYDWVFFLAPPTLALALGILISGTAFADSEFTLFGESVTASAALIGIFIHAHLAIVFVRSHGNPEIFHTHPARFVAVPIALFVAMLSSQWIFVSVSVIATFWDVYHSGAQTFGFARIYDRRAGNPPEVGRRLDFWLNQLLYAGPIVAGAVMLDHFEDFDEFSDIQSPAAAFFTAIPVYMQGHQAYFSWAIIAGGTAFLAYYLIAYARLQRAGYQVSMQKVYLLATTGFCSIYTWGFNSWGEAFFIMNFFHALQYFGLVWSSEKKSLMRVLRVSDWRLGPALALAAMLLFAFGYGAAAELGVGNAEHLLALTLVVSIMHFWYDGFIWSVRKKQV